MSTGFVYVRRLHLTPQDSMVSRPFPPRFFGPQVHRLRVGVPAVPRGLQRRRPWARGVRHSSLWLLSFPPVRICPLLIRRASSQPAPGGGRDRRIGPDEIGVGRHRMGSQTNRRGGHVSVSCGYSERPLMLPAV